MIPGSTAPPRLRPDPAALAQGHRALRLGRRLRLPIWVIGTTTVLGALTLGLYPSSAMLALVVGMLGAGALSTWLTRRQPLVERRATTERGAIPGELGDLVRRLEAWAELLERGEDWAFDREATELGLALVRLGEDARRKLDERGAGHRALQQTLGELELRRGLGVEQRRALHHALIGLAASIRGRACGDPYRAKIGGTGLDSALAWLSRGSSADPALRRARRRLRVAMVVIAALWVVLVPLLGQHLGLFRLRACGPLQPGGLARCLAMSSSEAVLASALLLLGAVPVFAALGALICELIARRSFRLSLPPASSPALDRRYSARVEDMRARRARIDGLIDIIAALTLVSTTLGLLSALWVLGDIAWKLETGHLDAMPVFVAELALGLPLASYGVVVAWLRRQLERAWIRDSLAWLVGAEDQRAHLLELVALRGSSSAPEPLLAEALETLLIELPQTARLAALEPEDVHMLEAELDTALTRGPALEPRQRRELERTLRACEELLVRTQARRRAPVDAPTLACPPA